VTLTGVLMKLPSSPSPSERGLRNEDANQAATDELD
jgi:hypothetical protein